MGDRLTDKWTPTLEEAFGETGKRGAEGEVWLAKVIGEQWGWEVETFDDDYKRQVQGHDLAIRKPGWANFYTVDVKNNLGDGGVFYVETSPTGWLFNPKKTNDRVWHVNPSSGWMAWYGRQEMIDALLQLKLYNTGLLKINPTDRRFKFITRRKANV